MQNYNLSRNLDCKKSTHLCKTRRSYIKLGKKDIRLIFKIVQFYVGIRRFVFKFFVLYSRSTCLPEDMVRILNIYRVCKQSVSLQSMLQKKVLLAYTPYTPCACKMVLTFNASTQNMSIRLIMICFCDYTAFISCANDPK